MSANTTRCFNALMRSSSSRTETGTLAARISLNRLSSIVVVPPEKSAVAATAHERQTLKQLHVLFVLDQGTGQRRDGLGRIALAQHGLTDVVGHQQLEPVHQFGSRRLLLQPRDFAHIEEHVQRLADQVLLDVGVMHIDDLLQRGAIREGDVVEEATAQERIRQLFFVVGGNDDDRADFGLDRLVDLVNVELHLVEFLQQVVGELDVSLVNFVDQQDHPFFGLEGFPQLAFLQVIAYVVDFIDTQLRVAQTADGVVFVQPLMSLGGRLDVPGDQPGAEGLGQLLGQHGLTSARLALDQQGALQRDGGVDGQLQVVSGDVCLGAFELHRNLLEHCTLIVESGAANRSGALNPGRNNVPTITRASADCERRRGIQSLNAPSHFDADKNVTLLEV